MKGFSYLNYYLLYVNLLIKLWCMKKEYRIRGGRIVTKSEIDELERSGWSEEDIAYELGISRMSLFKIRKKMGWPQRERSDKGIKKERLTDFWECL